MPRFGDISVNSVWNASLWTLWFMWFLRPGATGGSVNYVRTINTVVRAIHIHYDRQGESQVQAEELKLDACKIMFHSMCHMLPFMPFFFCTNCFYLPSPFLHPHGTSKRQETIQTSKEWDSFIVLDWIDVFIAMCFWRNDTDKIKGDVGQRISLMF